MKGAAAGTVVVMRNAELTVKVAGVPLKVTLVAPLRSVPRILSAGACRECRRLGRARQWSLRG